MNYTPQRLPSRYDPLLKVFMPSSEEQYLQLIVQMPDGSWKRQGLPEIMVSLDSAQLFYPKEQLIFSNTDHSRIAKLRRGENSIYPHIRSAIRRALLGLDEERATAELSKLQISPHEGDSSPNSVFRRNSKQKQAETTYSRLSQPSNFRTHVSVVPQERLGLEETSYGNSRRAQPSSKNRLLSGEQSSGATVDTADKSVFGWQNVSEIAEDTHGKPAMSSPSSRTDTETTSYGFDKQSGVSEGTLQAFPGIRTLSRPPLLSRQSILTLRELVLRKHAGAIAIRELPPSHLLRPNHLLRITK